jgi:hypothetical protein
LEKFKGEVIIQIVKKKKVFGGYARQPASPPINGQA